MKNLLLASVVLGLLACAEPPPSSAPTPAPPDTELAPIEATSLLGEPLRRPDLDDDFRVRQETLLAEAHAALDTNPDDADAQIWAGRRTAYLGRYGEAIEIYSQGIAGHPDDPRFYRHRGHRYLTTRQLDAAIADFEHAAGLLEGREPEVEPDGLPNAANIPTSNSHTNVWYHLALGRYLLGDFSGAADAWRECLRFSDNPDMDVAASYWLYLALRRQGLDTEAAEILAPISPDLELLENHDYHRLLLTFRGDLEPDLPDPGEPLPLGAATRAYGVGQWLVLEGNTEDGQELFRRVVAEGPWAAFGYLAAETQLAR